MHRHFGKGVIWLVTLLVFIALEGLLSWVTWEVYEGKKAFILERNSAVFADVHRSTRLAYTKLTKLLYDEVINKPDIIAIFKKADEADPQLQAKVRNQLYERLLPTFRRLKALNLRQLHFHLSDGTSFLRFHRPEKFGDSLVGVRYSVELANREKRYVEGFEEGRVYNGFRHVFPLFDETGNHLGSVEISLSFDALRNDMEMTTGDHIDFAIRRDLVERKVWPEAQAHYRPSLISPDYLYERRDASERLGHAEYDAVAGGIAEEASALMAQNRRFALYRKGYVIVFEPVSNVEGAEGAAYLIGYNATNAVNEILESSVTLWGVSSFVVLLTTLLLYLLMDKMSHISKVATYDMLTGLLNRNHLTQRIEDEMARTARTRDPFSIIFLDIDNFKGLNDLFGHELGDRVLKQVAALLKENIRRNDIVGRWGGEEFLVCLPHTGCDAAAVVAEKLRQAIASDDFEIGKSVTCSFGVACHSEDEHFEATISRADGGLYRAKAEGKNRVVVL
jgi:diguanylate cyclase (GGDEF)-like protein